MKLMLSIAFVSAMAVVAAVSDPATAEPPVEPACEVANGSGFEAETCSDCRGCSCAQWYPPTAVWCVC